MITDRDFRVMWEDMIEEALWPTLTSYDTFPTNRYESDSRLKGSMDFVWHSSASEFPLIRWKYLGADGPTPWATQVFSMVLNGEVAVAVYGSRDIDGATAAAHQIAMTDLGLARQVIKFQEADTTLPAGPFGIGDTSVVGGQGTSPLSCVVDVQCGEDVLVESSDDGEAESLGPNVWTATMPVSIVVLVTA